MCFERLIWRYTPLSCLLYHHPLFHSLSYPLLHLSETPFFFRISWGFFSFSLHIRSRNKAYPIWHRYYVNVIIPLDVKQCIILHIRLLIFKFSHTNENKLCIEIYNKTTNRIHVKSVSRHHINPRSQAIGPRSDIGISV